MAIEQTDRDRTLSRIFVWAVVMLCAALVGAFCYEHWPGSERDHSTSTRASS